MKKNIILMYLLFLLIIPTFANDETLQKSETPKKTNAIEVSIGGGVNHEVILFFSKNEITNLKKNYDVHIDTTRNNYFNFGFESKTLTIPFSLIYYPNQYFGFGINYTFGFGGVLYQAIIPFCMLINNKMKLINKIGNIYSENFFVVEYGLFYSGFFYPFSRIGYLQNYIGPTLFLGYQWINEKKNFSYSVGGTFDAIFKKEVNNSYIISSTTTTNIFLFGIDIRWNFNFIKIFEH